MMSSRYARVNLTVIKLKFHMPSIEAQLCFPQWWYDVFHSFTQPNNNISNETQLHILTETWVTAAIALYVLNSKSTAAWTFLPSKSLIFDIIAEWEWATSTICKITYSEKFQGVFEIAEQQMCSLIGRISLRAQFSALLFPQIFFFINQW